MVPDKDSTDLKIEELLKDVRLDRAASKALDRATSSIADAIRQIPDQEVTAAAAPGFIRDLGVAADKVSFKFKSPEAIVVGGSHSIGCVVKPDVNVDLLIRMPKECFHEKDYLNHRYHAKRCLYLCAIAASLRSSRLVHKVEWSTFQNEARKPVLIVFPVMELCELGEFFIRVIPSATSLFDVSKLNLARNNVRAFNQEDDVSLPTPKYNSSILEDMFLEENAEIVKKAFLDWKSLEEALVLMKVWARQRSSIYTYDCLSGYLISVILSYISAEGNHINRSMKPLHMFRITLRFIASSSFWEKGLSFQHSNRHQLSKEDLIPYLHQFGVVIVASSGDVNLTFRIKRLAFSELQDEAAAALNCLGKCRDGGFEEIFLTRVDFAAKFDSCLRIDFKGNGRVNASGFCLDDECWRTWEDNLHFHLREGLSDRAKLVRVTWGNTPSKWNIAEGFSKFDDQPVLVGILYSSPEKSLRMKDVGPNPGNKEEVVKFRNFWGEKAELRRYQDGTIAESTVWDCKPWESHIIIKKIIEYVLSKHFLLSKEDMVHTVDQLDFCLNLGGEDPISSYGHLLKAFEVLSQRLRLLEEVPLRISSVQPLDPALRGTSVYPPELHPLAFEKRVQRAPRQPISTCIQSLEVMIQLEGSGNWPLGDEAIEKTKSAFLLKIGESLQDRWGMICDATDGEVNILMSGFAFRLRILHERGLDLSRNQAGHNKVKGTSSTDKLLFLCSQHASMINGLHGRFPLYGPVVRLAKRWVSSHLFSSFLAEEAVELIVAYLFLKPLPFHAPSSRITGFLRFLRLLSTFDWSFSPLIVDINSDITLDDEKEINEKFILSRKACEASGQEVEPAMFLATSYDKFSEVWTKSSPIKPVLERMALYAQVTAKGLTNLILQSQPGPYTWESLFRTPFDSYDAVVHLHRDKVSYPERLLFPTEINQGKLVISGKASKDFHPHIPFRGSIGNLENARDKLMIDFDPTSCLLEDLKREFPGTFKVWCDPLGGDAIGLTWEKISKKRNRDEADETQRDPIDILRDIGELGKGLVRSVHLLKAPRR